MQRVLGPDVQLPALYSSFPGAVLILSLATYPYVYLLSRAAFARAQDWRMIRRKRVEQVVEAQKAGTTASWQFEMPMRCVSSPQIRLWLTRGTGKHPIRISCNPQTPSQPARIHLSRRFEEMGSRRYRRSFQGSREKATSHV